LWFAKSRDEFEQSRIYAPGARNSVAAMFVVKNESLSPFIIECDG
jgi:hypothetical protein